MFDFDTVINRAGTGALKWDRRTPEEKDAGVIPLSVADMEFATAPCVREAVESAARHGLYGYTDPTEAYLDAVCAWMERRHAWRVLPREITCAGGVIPAVSQAVRALTRPGDRVILQSPGYAPLRAQIEGNGRVLVENPLREADGHWLPDLDLLSAQAKDAKALLLCSPHNPSGRVWTREELSAIAEICRQNSLTVIVDEIHHDIILSGAHTVFATISPYARENTLTCTSAGKAFNLAGLQTANVICHNPAMTASFRARRAADGQSNIPYFGLAATQAAYTAGDAWLDALTDALRQNHAILRRFFAEKLPLVRAYPLEGTYLAWTDWRAFPLRGKALDDFLRGECRLILSPGAMFGACGQGFQRFNIALPKGALARALDKLNLCCRNVAI